MVRPRCVLDASVYIDLNWLITLVLCFSQWNFMRPRPKEVGGHST